MTAPKRPWTRWPAEDEQEALAMYREGRSLREIAEWFGRTVGSTWSMLHRLGAEMRRPAK